MWSRDWSKCSRKTCPLDWFSRVKGIHRKELCLFLLFCQTPDVGMSPGAQCWALELSSTFFLSDLICFHGFISLFIHSTNIPISRYWGYSSLKKETKIPGSQSFLSTQEIDDESDMAVLSMTLNSLLLHSVWDRVNGYLLELQWSLESSGSDAVWLQRLCQQRTWPRSLEMLTPRALHSHIRNIQRPPCWRVCMLAFWSTFSAKSALPPKHEMREGNQLGSGSCSLAALAPAISSLPAKAPDIRGRVLTVLPPVLAHRAYEQDKMCKRQAHGKAPLFRGRMYILSSKFISPAETWVPGHVYSYLSQLHLNL